MSHVHIVLQVDMQSREHNVLVHYTVVDARLLVVTLELSSCSSVRETT